MSAAYEHLPLAEVKPGMVLSDELLDQQGQVLLPKGAVLSEQTIALLPAHGIVMLAVACPAGAREGAADKAAIERRLAHLFRKNDVDDDDDWATGVLRRYVSNYRLEREIEP